MKPRLFATILLMLSLDAALAVSPLVTDDADTVEPAHLQLNAGWQFSRTASASLSSLPVNPVLGLNSYGELGATFGYQWSDGPTQADGITDLLISTKWRFWHGSDDTLRVSARFDLKAPTATADRGLGTGKTDGGIVLIATGSWGQTSLDWNIGYSFNDVSPGVFGDDNWFLGQAVRQELSEHWTLIGETFAVLPHTGEGGSANVHFNGGLQFSVRENVLISGLIGSAAGKNSPDLTSYLGFTIVF
jgi:hypothetical protein